MVQKTKKTGSSKKSKRISLAEFRAWLSGVEELQPKDWCPNAEQWKLIRGKINMIEAGQSFEGQPQQVAFQPPRPPMPTGPIARGLPPPPPPAGSSGFPEGPTAIMPITADGKIKTPDIDTSQGKYGSSFT